MPYVDYTTEDEIKKKEQGDQSAPAGQSGGQSTAFSSTAGSGQSVGSGKGTGFTNLQDYLGNNAGQGMATTQQVLDNKQKTVNSAVDALNKEATTTQESAKAGTIQRNTDLENQVKNTPQLIDKNVYSQYTQQQYGGPKEYTPSVDVEKQWQNLPTQTSLGQVADPKSIGKQLGKSDYSYGMGKLDSYLINSEGQGAIDGYNKKNANVSADREKQVKSTQDTIKRAQEESAANVQALRDATTQSYKDWSAKAQASVKPAQEKAFDQARSEIQAKLDAAGVEGPGGLTGINTYIRPTQGYGWQDAVDEDTWKAINALAEIDSDPSTNMVSRSGNGPLSVDWASLDQYINANRPAQPVTTTATVASGAAGDKIGREYATTTYPDGSYDVAGPDGEIVRYNADGSVRSTAGTNIFT